MANEIKRILAKDWSREEIEEFISNCYDRQALIASLSGYARKFMTHRMLMRYRDGNFRPFLLQGWPPSVDEEAKTPRLRKLRLPAATSKRVKKAIEEGYPVAAPPNEFALQRVLDFLGVQITEEFLCEPVTVGPTSEWILIGKPIRIDPSSESFSTDAITLNFHELEEVCEKLGTQYQRIRRLQKRNQLPPSDQHIPDLSKLTASRAADDDYGEEDAFTGIQMGHDFEPIEVNKRTQKRVRADANDFSAERFLAGEDAFSGQRDDSVDEQPKLNIESLDASPPAADDDEEGGVGVTTGRFKIDPNQISQLNYGQEAEDDKLHHGPNEDHLPSIGEIENTSALELDMSVIEQGRQLYADTLRREEAREKAEREKQAQLKRQARAQQQNRANRPITAEEKANVRRAIALMDSSERDKAFKAARYIASFGERSLKTLGRLFPGRLFIDRYQFRPRELPPVERHGPVLYALVSLGEPALKVARHYVTDTSNDLRFYATYLFSRLPAHDDLERLLERLFDRDRQTRTVAQRVLVSQRDTPTFEHIVLRPLRQELRNPTDELRMSMALETLGRCRDIEAIDDLIDILKFRSARAKQRAHEALQRITFQSLSAAAVSWEQWWANQRPEHKDKWLVQALDSEADHIRQWAWQEVARMPNVELDYNPNYPRAQRVQAQHDLAVFLGIQQY